MKKALTRDGRRARELQLGAQISEEAPLKFAWEEKVIVQDRPPADKSDRQVVLENAIKHTVGARDIEYGSPIPNMEDIAALWTAYVSRRHNVDITLSGEDVAWMNALLKMARTFNGAV